MRGNGWYALGLAAALLAGAWWTPHILHETKCLFVRVFPAKASGPDKLLACSNIIQSVHPYPEGGLQDLEAQVPGWRMFTSSGAPVRIMVKFRKTSGHYTFYPRLDGEADSIAIYECLGKDRRLVYWQQGNSAGWTPVARRMLFCADCVRDGWSEEEFPVELEIVLDGPHAQLWHKDGLIFY